MSSWCSRHSGTEPLRYCCPSAAHLTRHYFMHLPSSAENRPKAVVSAWIAAAWAVLCVRQNRELHAGRGCCCWCASVRVLRVACGGWKGTYWGRWWKLAWRFPKEIIFSPCSNIYIIQTQGKTGYHGDRLEVQRAAFFFFSFSLSLKAHSCSNLTSGL